MCSKSEKAFEFPKQSFFPPFSFEHVIWFFDNTGEYLLPKTLSVSAQLKNFRKTNYFWKKVWKSTSDRQTHSSNKPAKLSGQKSMENNSKYVRKVTETMYSTESIFPQIVSWETSKVAWQRCRSFSVNLLFFSALNHKNMQNWKYLRKTAQIFLPETLNPVSATLWKYFCQNFKKKSVKIGKNLENS